MKLDVNVLRYLSKDDFRVLTAVEMGQKNHEIVPASLVDTIARLKHGGTHKCLKELLRHKLVHHESKKYDGYRLTSMGYDFLAIKTLTNRGSMSSVGRKIGVGKEADIYEVADDDGNRMCLKLHRLGRTSFRAIKSKRDYLRQGSHYSWLYLSRLSAVKEFAFMQALGKRGLPVPEAIDQNRHAVLMSLVDAFPLCQIRTLARPAFVYTELINLMERLAKMGLVHCDFNEFNILINEDEEVTLIDFPQMVSTNHANADELFERDVDCLIRFFSKKLGYVPSMDPDLARVRPDFQLAAPSTGDLDAELRASGFKREHQKVLESVAEEEDEDDEAGSSSDDEEEDASSGATPSGDESDTEASDAEGRASSSDDDASGSESSSSSRTRPAAGERSETAQEPGPSTPQPEANEEEGSSLGEEQDVEDASQRMEDLDIAAQQQAVAEKLRMQQKKAARKAAMASASRNAMKGRNKGKRRNEGGGGGGINWG